MNNYQYFLLWIDYELICSMVNQRKFSANVDNKVNLIVEMTKNSVTVQILMALTVISNWPTAPANIPGTHQGWSPAPFSSGCRGCFSALHRCTRFVRGRRSGCRKHHRPPVSHDRKPPTSPLQDWSASVVQKTQTKNSSGMQLLVIII